MLAGSLDVFHFSDWMYPRQRGGVRATTVHDLFPLRHPDWVHPQTYRGTRVVASGHPSLDEASGDVALRAHPEKADEFAIQTEHALNRDTDRASRGLEHAGRFTAGAQGETVLKAYGAALG